MMQVQLNSQERQQRRKKKFFGIDTWMILTKSGSIGVVIIFLQWLSSVE
jgi:hypothetical protein